MGKEYADRTPGYRELDAARHRAWRRAHPEIKAAQNKAYKESLKRRGFRSYRHMRALQKQQRRQQAREAPFERVNWVLVYVRDNGICHICQEEVEDEDITMDHVVPLSRGGGFTYDNIKLAHRKCNSSKGNR